MSYEREQDLHRQAQEHETQARELRLQGVVEAADGYWRAGDRGRALRVLHNGGVDDLVGFCRARGLSEDDARAEIRTADIDWS